MNEDPSSPYSAHPRVSGENLTLTVHTRAAGGSSPRERGKLTVWKLVGLVPRLIPA